MAERLTGKLSFDKGKWKIVFFDETKQKDITLFCQKNVFASDLHPQEGEVSEVDFERDSSPQKNAIKVRAKGKEWVGEQSQTASVDYSRKSNVPHSGRSRFGIDNGFTPRQTKGAAQTMQGKFHNPYNFIPAPDRITSTGEPIAGELGDREPSGHDRYLSDKYSGKLRVRMRVETPLLLPDTARVGVGEIGDSDHKNFPVRTKLVEDKEGKTIEVPDINPTAIKGMLRSAYEAVTNSRLSVFHKHDERLAFRMESTEGARSVPARIEKDETDGKLYVVLHTGTSELGTDGRPLNDDVKATDGERNPILCAAWIKTYYAQECKVDRAALKLADKNRLPNHKEKVFAWLEKASDPKGRFCYWRVKRMVKDKTKLGFVAAADNIEAEGYVCVTAKNTGKDAHPNIGNKHDERLFFNVGNTPRYKPIELNKVLVSKWDDLIKDYRREHDNGKGELEDPPKARKRDNNGRTTEYSLQWSRHILATAIDETGKDSHLEKEKLEHGALCYARVLKNAVGEFDVIELYPVTISRRIHQVSPGDLLPSELHPAYKMKELSPADRVFGWVRQTDKGKNKTLSPEEKELAAYRGQVRIGAVELAKDNPTGNGIEYCNRDTLPLQILGQPKPQQGRFYVAKDKQGRAQPKVDEQTEDGLTNERAGYNNEATKGLRGRKVYPHHNVPRDYWQLGKWATASMEESGVTFFQEYRRPDGQKQRDNQNRSVERWIRKNTVFEFDIHFINLSKVELGAFVWLIDLPENHYHRFGGGKPLGFGSVRLDLVESGSELLSGEEMTKRFESLDPTVAPSLTAAQCKTEFETAFNNASLAPDILTAFKNAAKGFAKPVHYPRKGRQPSVEGKNFEWFVANSKTNIKQDDYGKVVRNEFGEDLVEVKHGYALPDLTNEIGLPFFPEEQRGRGKGRRR